MCKCSVMMAPPTLMTANCCEETEVKCERYCCTSRLEPMLLSSWTTVERVENWESAGDVYCRRLIFEREVIAGSTLLGAVLRDRACRHGPFTGRQL